MSKAQEKLIVGTIGILILLFLLSSVVRGYLAQQVIVSIFGFSILIGAVLYAGEDLKKKIK